MQLLKPGDFTEHLYTASIVVAGPSVGEWIPNLLRPIGPLPLAVCLVDDAADRVWSQEKLSEAEAALIWLGESVEVPETLHQFILQAAGDAVMLFGAGKRWEAYLKEISAKVSPERTPFCLTNSADALGAIFNAWFWKRRRCFVCGCADDHACDGGCSWVGPNLCSACLAKMVEREADPDA